MKGILVDVTKCTGCETCVAACISANKLDPEKAARDRTTSKDGLSANLFCAVEKVRGRYVRKACMHCLDPGCAAACPVGALEKTAVGPVEYDPSKCIGCRYCMLACPFSIPRYEWDSRMPFVKKCTMCFERQKDGKKPACVEACPHGALTFGDRDALLKKARALVDNNPRIYKSRIWGESSLGGSSLLYVSDVDLSEIGWPQEKSEAIPEITEPLIRKTPVIGLTVGLGLWGVMTIVERRRKLNSGNEDHESSDELEGNGE